jgi:hypothetical protein
VFENKVLRRTFRPDKSEVTGGFRKIHNEELHYLKFSRKYYYNNKIKEDVMDRAYSTHESDVCIQIFYREIRRKEKEEQSIFLEDNIKMNHREIRRKVRNRFMCPRIGTSGSPL